MDDLGGLGAREGPRVVYAWVPPSLIPTLLPWIGVLLLLLLPRNRAGQAWWIWVPWVALVFLIGATHRFLGFLPSEAVGMFADAAGAVAFGLTTIWLVGWVFARWHRFLGFLGMLFSLALAGAFALGVAQIAEDSLETLLPGLMLLGFCAVMLATALSLSAVCCRQQCRPGRLVLWMLLWLPVAGLALGAPFFVIAAMTSGGEAPWLEFLGGMLMIAGVCLVAVLPFLVLSFLSGFYRERLHGLLGFPQTVPASPETHAPVPGDAPGAVAG